MEQILPFLPIIIAALVCPISMGAMMWYMMRREGHTQMSMPSIHSASHEEHLKALKAEKDALEKQIRELESVRALQEKCDALANDIGTHPAQTQKAERSLQ